MRKLATGTRPYIGATFGTSTAITGITNATTPVFTFASGHGITVNDYFEVTDSGWSELSNRVLKATAVSTNDVTAVGVDTSSVTVFPAAGGAGTGRKISTWVEIQQALADQIQISGGEQGFGQGRYIQNRLSYEFPTEQAPLRAQFVVDEDQSLAYWTPVKASFNGLANYPIRFNFPGGDVAVGTGIWTISAGSDISNFIRRRTILVAMAAVFSEI